MESVSDQVEQAPVHQPILQQAPVKALDPDGKLVLRIGTGAFAVATLICGILYPTLAASGQLWRLWVAAAGLALGVIALVVVAVASRRRKAEGLEVTEPR
jgi:hypothetical protein